MLSDSAIEMMAKDFERPAWRKTEPDRIFAERSARQLRTEQARRRAARKIFTGEPLTDAEQTAWSNAHCGDTP